MNPNKPAACPQIQQATPEPLLPIIFHLTYHPRGLQRAQIHSVYTETMAPLLETERQLIIAVSHPKNLQDRVCSTRLPNVETDNPLLDYILHCLQGELTLPANSAQGLAHGTIRLCFSPLAEFTFLTTIFFSTF
jgi:hypothetical protein